MAEDRRTINRPLGCNILFDANNLRVLSVGADAKAVQIGQRITVAKDARVLDMGYGWKIVHESQVAHIIDEGGQLCLTLY